jgi:hypothetical protein
MIIIDQRASVENPPRAQNQPCRAATLTGGGNLWLRNGVL